MYTSGGMKGTGMQKLPSAQDLKLQLQRWLEVADGPLAPFPKMEGISPQVDAAKALLRAVQSYEEVAGRSFVSAI